MANDFLQQSLLNPMATKLLATSSSTTLLHHSLILRMPKSLDFFPPYYEGTSHSSNPNDSIKQQCHTSLGYMHNLSHSNYKQLLIFHITPLINSKVLPNYILFPDFLFPKTFLPPYVCVSSTLVISIHVDDDSVLIFFQTKWYPYHYHRLCQITTLIKENQHI